MRLVVLLLVAAALAGCADNPQPIIPRAPTFSDSDVPRMPEARWEWRALAATGFSITPTTATELPFDVPERAIAVYANLTLQQGAAVGLDVDVAGCSARYSGNVVAVGQELVFDCLSPAAAPSAARVATSAGALSGTLEVVALVCVEPVGVVTRC